MAQRPKLAPHLEQMRENLAAQDGGGAEQVSVKATTEEGWASPEAEKDRLPRSVSAGAGVTGGAEPTYTDSGNCY